MVERRGDDAERLQRALLGVLRQQLLGHGHGLHAAVGRGLVAVGQRLVRGQLGDGHAQRQLLGDPLERRKLVGAPCRSVEAAQHLQPCSGLGDGGEQPRRAATLDTCGKPNWFPLSCSQAINKDQAPVGPQAEAGPAAGLWDLGAALNALPDVGAPEPEPWHPQRGGG